MKFAVVVTASALKPAPPYPRLEILYAPGRVHTTSTGGAFELARGEMAAWTYLVDAVTIASHDRAEYAERIAFALADGFERLVRRNEYLGGLVELITAEGPPALGGAVDTGKSGNVAGVMTRFRVEVKRSIV